MAESKTWVRQVRQQGEGSVSRTDRELTGRTDYLKERLDAAEFGQAVFAHDATLDPDLLEGQPVFWNDSTQRFEAALAAAENDEASGTIVPAASSDCLGLLYAKENSTKGSILLFGYAPLDLANSAGEDAPAGRYYLSPAEAGKLVLQRPAVSVPVLFNDGNGRVFVQPAYKDFAEAHVHYAFELATRPAGLTTPPGQGYPHTIDTPDPTIRGWLPAESFGARAPAGAKFGYNLAAHPEIERVWPPIPIEGASLLLDGGDDGRGVETHIGGDEIIQFDRFGIWWMTDCYDQVPWPTNYGVLDLNISDSSLSSSSSSLGDGCSLSRPMRMILGFTKMSFATGRTSVTSLQPSAGSPLQFLDCDGKPATTGDLFAKFVSEFLVSDNDVDGNLALKTLDGNKFTRGYMVQGVRSGNDNLTITGTRNKTISGVSYAQGLLTLAVNLDPSARDLPTHLVRLDNVKERYYEDVMYLGLPPAVESSIRAKIKVPGAGLPANPKVKLRVQLLARASGSLPNLTVTYRVIGRPTAAIALPLVDTALTFSSAQTIGGDEYVEVESAEFTVAAGDTVLFTVERGDSDGYSGEIGLLDLTGVLFSGG